MNESSVNKSPASTSPARCYALASDLARMCLPSRLADAGHRRLAWTNSICLLFLAVGLVGLKPPAPTVQKPPARPEEIVPVVFSPPPEQPKPEPLLRNDEPAAPPVATEPAPQVVAVVAAAKPATVAFAVPVPGVVAVAEPRFATPPPRVAPVPAEPSRFDPSAARANSDAGSYPPPQYPSYAVRNHYQGKVTIELTVSPEGVVTNASVWKTSGYTLLDEAALNVVKNRWRFPPGPARWYYWPCEFRLE